MSLKYKVVVAIGAATFMAVNVWIGMTLRAKDIAAESARSERCHRICIKHEGADTWASVGGWAQRNHYCLCIDGHRVVIP